ncbi:MAG: exodeoxyribonuclease VII small subunit [Fusobacteriaceae bacterium]
MEKKTKLKESFEGNIDQIDEIVKKLESGELPLEQSIKEYEKAMKLLKKSSDILNIAEGKILKVIENSSGEIEFQEV